MICEKYFSQIAQIYSQGDLLGPLGRYLLKRASSFPSQNGAKEHIAHVKLTFLRIF